MPRILIAGDQALMSQEIRVVFDAKGYQLIFIDRLVEAVNLILEDPPDLLIIEKGFGGGEESLIRAGKACLQKANMPIILVLPESKIAAIDWHVMPVDDVVIKPFSPEVLLAHVQLAEARMIRVFDNNPLSRLPGNTSILRQIQKALDSRESYGVCYVDIDNFKPYNDRYGFSHGDDVILMVARILVNVAEELAREQSFVGHVGGDDFVMLVKEEKIQPVCEKVLANFDVVRNMFLSSDDVKVGGYVEMDRQGRETRYGLLSLSIAVVTTGADKFKHFGEVTTAASQVKHCVKQKEGSNYMIDRRSGYVAGTFEPA